MSTFTETKVLQSLEIFPALNVINVKHLATTLKDGVKFMEQTEAKSYSTSQFSDFKIEVAPMGGTLAEIVAGFSQAALDAASTVPATLAEKDAEQVAAKAAHTTTLAAKDVELATLETANIAALATKDAERTTLEATHATTLAAKDAELAAATAAHASATAALELANTEALAAKDATIASLQAQIEANKPPVVDPLGPVVNDLQIRLAMNKVGLRKAVEDAIAASTDQAMKDWYDRANQFKRHDPMVLGMVHSLEVSDADADALWALAETL